MSQNDYIIANDTAANVRADLNLALQALASTSSGATEPSTTYANMLWYDTANNILKMRSEADDAWIDLGTLDQSTNTFTPAGVAELTQTQVEDDTSTVFGQVSGQRLAQAVAANAAVGGGWEVYDGAGGTTALWDFARDGVVTVVTSPTFEDGYEYAMLMDSVSPATNSSYPLCQIYREASEDWSASFSQLISINAAGQLNGMVSLILPRLARRLAHIRQEWESGLAGYGSDYQAVQDMTTAQKVGAMRFQFHNSSNLDAGTIWMLRRPTGAV